MDNQPLHSPRDIQRTVLVSLGIVGLSLGVYFFFHRSRTPAPTSINTAITFAAVTPETYTMISGKIVAIDAEAKTIAVDFSVVNQRGQGTMKRYLVTIGAKTVLQSVQPSVTVPAPQTIEIKDFAIGDTVDALSDTNIAATTSFTATTIIRSQR